jgi:hypothetical protein
LTFFSRIAISKAFKYWSDYSELNFQEVCMSCPADLVIDFNEADHKDGNPFDGESGVLAHAYFPKGNFLKYIPLSLAANGSLKTRISKFCL